MSATKLGIGDEVSWKDGRDKWRGVIVRDILDQKIQIQLRHPAEDEDKQPFLVDYLDWRFSKNPNIKYTDKKPVGDYFNPPYPKHYFDNTSNKHYIIISQSKRYDEDKILVYDIDKDEYVDPIQYSDNFHPEAHGIAVDSDNHMIYFCYQNYTTSKYYFGAYDISTKQWDAHEYIEGDINLGRWRFNKVEFIDSSLYFRVSDGRENYILKYSLKNRKCIQLTKNFPEKKLGYYKVCYDKAYRKVIVYGGFFHSDDGQDEEQSNDIWTYDIDQDDENGVWELLPAKIACPDKQNNCQLVMGFDSILFVLFKMNEIWCLELRSNKWFKSHVHFPAELVGKDIVHVNDNYIYIMNYDTINVRINLYDMIPIELMESYTIYYLPLIHGYVRMEFEDKSDKVHVSQDLTQLIAKYFNAFLNVNVA